MKIVYYLTNNPSQFSFLYNIYKLYNGPIYYPTYDVLSPSYLNDDIEILKNINELNDYNPDFILYTDFNAIIGNWKNIYIGHGYGYDIFQNSCDNSILSHDEYTQNGLSYSQNDYDFIFVPSELIKNDISKYYKINSDKIKVIGYPRLDDINKIYLVNYTKKITILYAPSWNIKSSLYVMQDNIIKLSEQFNIIILFHSNLMNSPINKINSAKKIVDNMTESLKIVFRQEYSNLFDDINDKYIIKFNGSDMNLLQNLILSTDFLLCDRGSGASWDALFLEKPYLKLDEFKKLDYGELLSKINNTKVINKFTYCGDTYIIEDIFGKKDGKNSKRCIDTLKELI
jgi:hypothetical protein